MNLKQRIRHDAKRVAGDLEASALLECLVKHLFNPDLDAKFLGKACGAGREVRERLAALVGPLKGYVTELRMIEAKRLARETKLTVGEMGRRLGYRVTRTFHRAFKRRYRMSPGEMRKRARAERTGAPDATAAAESASEGLTAEGLAGEDDGHPTPRARAARLRRRLALGLLDEKDAGELRAELRRRHPRLEEQEAGEDEPAPAANRVPLALLSTGDHVQGFAASAIFDRVLAMPEDDLRFAMLDGVRLGTSAAIDVLMELCSLHTRLHPDRAVAVAELGVQLLELHREVMAEEAGAQMARAWVKLGRVKMLASDFAGARRAVNFAFDEVAEGEMPSQVEIEAHRVEGMAHMHEGDNRAAAQALGRAVVLARERPLSDPARAQSLLEALSLASFLGQGYSTTAFWLCCELEELVEAGAAGTERVDFWRGLVAFHRGKANVDAGCDHFAEMCLRAAAQHVAADQQATEPAGAAVYETAVLGSFVTHELARLAGRYYRHFGVYETLLRDAVERYRLIRAPVFQAAAEAELAVLAALTGEADEARRLASSAADFLDRLPGHRRAWSAALKLRALAADPSPRAAGPSPRTAASTVGLGQEAQPQAEVLGAGAAAPAEELVGLLAALTDDLDAVRWEITGVQATPASLARRRPPRRAGA